MLLPYLRPANHALTGLVLLLVLGMPAGNVHAADPATAAPVSADATKPGVEIQGMWVAFGTPAAAIAAKLSLTGNKTGDMWDGAFTSGKLNYRIEITADGAGNVRVIRWGVWTGETTNIEPYLVGPAHTEQWWGKPTSIKSDGQLEKGYDCGDTEKRYKRGDAVLKVTESVCPFGLSHDLFYELVATSP